MEDDWELNRGIAWQLEKAHYETCVAYSVEEAKRILCEESVHLVLLDVNLPDGDGFAVLESGEESVSRRVPDSAGSGRRCVKRV